jgi:16S rRNA (cytidine1402-2'-O)-methyltransferase
VPGPSALISALSLSGLPTGRFCFEGFLSTTAKNRREHLASLMGEERTMIFYEAPHKLVKTLSDLIGAFGPERRVAVCRELTKVHEEVLRTTLSDALRRYQEAPPRGEFVLVVEGAVPDAAPSATADDAMELVDAYRAEGFSLREACRKAAADTGFSKNELYSLALKQ